MDEHLESRKEAVASIKQEFEVPETAAMGWHRHIGNVEDIKTALKNRTAEYTRLIRQREWLLDDRSKREDGWIQPLRQWVEQKSETSLLGDSPDRFEEYNRKREQVRYELCRVDPFWRQKTQKLRQRENKLVRYYKNHLTESEASYATKKSKIIELKTHFPYLRANNRLVARAVNSTPSYAGKFKHIPGEGVGSRRVKGKLRTQVLERDEYSCVVCDSTADLTVHHIIPRSTGGANNTENLATLCESCHYFAHGGGEPVGDGRYSTADWEEVDYNDREEFWETWIDQDFSDRRTRSSSS